MLAIACAAGAAGLVLRAVLRELRHQPLEGRVCLVAGDLDGRERVLARHLLWRGAKVALIGLGPDSEHRQAALERARDELSDTDLLVAACDPTDPDSVRAALAKALDELGEVDILLTAAPPGPLSELVAARLVVVIPSRDGNPERSAQRTLDAIEGGRTGPGLRRGFRSLHRSL